MSGGAYEYICYKIQDIEIYGINEDPRRASFQKLLKLVGDAMHDIEWVDSCDYGRGDEYEAIDKVFAFLGSDPATIAKAHAFDELRDRLTNYFKDRK